MSSRRRLIAGLGASTLAPFLLFAQQRVTKVALVGVLAMYWAQYQNTGVLSFDMIQMETAGFSQNFQYIWFLPVFFGFAVLGGIWPFHNWSPDGHVAAPTAVSMFHAGVLMKLGAFAALRVGIMLLPQGIHAQS